MIIPKIGFIVGTGSPLMRPIPSAILSIVKPTIARGKNFTTVSFGDFIG